MRPAISCTLWLLVLPLALTLGESPAHAQCPDFDGDGTPDGTGCESGPTVPVSPPTPVGPPPEQPSPEQPPPEQPSPGQPSPEAPPPAETTADPGVPASSSWVSSTSGGGGSSVDPAVAAQRAAEAAEARAAWDLASSNLRALGGRGRALDVERDAFRRMFEDPRLRRGRVADQLVRVPLTGAAGAPSPPPWQGSAPPARGRRLAGPPPPPLGAGDFAPVERPWREPAPIAGLFDPRELLRAARDRAIQKTKEWLTEQARDVIERNVPGVRRLREMYETLQQYAELGRDLSEQNEQTVDGVFRAAGEVTRCMTGRPCDAAFVDSLAVERGQATRDTAQEWIRELTGEGGGNAEGDDGDDGDGQGGVP